MEDHGRDTGLGSVGNMECKPERPSAYRQAIEEQGRKAAMVREQIHQRALIDEGRKQPHPVDPRGQIGIGGAPTRATTLPSEPIARKQHPVASGVLDYFPDAIAALARVSWQGNEQHNPGQPLHWARGKSADEADTMLRHFLERGTLDKDGLRHTAKMAWRALALLQKEIEAEQQLAARGGAADAPYADAFNTFAKSNSTGAAQKQISSRQRQTCPIDGERDCCYEIDVCERHVGRRE